MSKSFGKIGTLAKCYDHLNLSSSQKEKKKKYQDASVRSIAGVEDKIEAALEKGSLPQLATPSINADEADSLTGQHVPSELATTESQEGAVGGTLSKKDLATALIDPDQLWDNFFSGVVMDEARGAIEEGIEEQEQRFAHSMEVRQAALRSERRLSDVCNFPIKLILTPLKRGRKMATAFASMLEMQFGPLHAALQVGHVVLEWNDSNLVTPYLCAAEDQVMELDVQQHSQWVKYTAQHSVEMQRAARDLDFSEQVELTYKVTSEKKSLIDALIKVIIKYNKFHYYNLFDRNCQHFVMDALDALEVRIPKQLPGGLGKYFKALVEGRTPSLQKEFKTHSALDEYVTQQQSIGSMPQHDLEFLLTLYFRFHLESKAKLKGDGAASRAWQCQEQGCRMGEVEKLIKVESLKIHQFCAS